MFESFLCKETPSQSRTNDSVVPPNEQAQIMLARLADVLVRRKVSGARWLKRLTRPGARLSGCEKGSRGRAGQVTLFDVV